MYAVSRAWLYGSVKPYFEKNGIKLLRDDLIYIEKCLTKIPSERHKKVMKDYFEIWNTKFSNADSEGKKKINPRYEANSFLASIAG